MSRSSNVLTPPAASIAPVTPPAAGSSGEERAEPRGSNGATPRAVPECSTGPARRRSDVIIGSSPAIERVRELLAIVVRTQIPVLVLGESGTGKELVARAIHYGGERAARPFITVNCGAVPETLMEDELFGHARGAYTGAHSDKMGVFEEADGGSLLFDEIGDLYPSCQVKLLRVLQEMEVRRLGENRSRQVDVRLIAATNKDLRKEMQEKRFREDLFHRVSVLVVQMPPLRERIDDLTLLVDHYVRQFSRDLGRPTRGFTARALEKMRAYPWPGNVRELENRIKQAMLMSRGEMIDVDALSLSIDATEGSGYPTFRRAKAEFERAYVAQTLRIAGGKVAAAARLAGKDRADFYDLMKKLTIDPNDYRA